MKLTEEQIKYLGDLCIMYEENLMTEYNAYKHIVNILKVGRYNEVEKKWLNGLFKRWVVANVSMNKKTGMMLIPVL